MKILTICIAEDAVTTSAKITIQKNITTLKKKYCMVATVLHAGVQ